MKIVSITLDRTYLLLSFYLFLSFLLSEQVVAGKLLPPQTMVSGVVMDTGGIPLAGVNIVVESTQQGAISDFDGSFEIVAGPDDVLFFSMVGFKSLSVPILGKEVVMVQMEEDVTVLGEVVLNAGYYTVSERERTGSIEKVSTMDIEKQPISNPLAALQGRMAGVEIQQTSGFSGSNFNIRIRGRNSIRSQGNDPLYIVDGVPFSSSSLGDPSASITLPGSGMSPLNDLNPNDIESIEILKDADATAIYGSRGANGVVLITTKKGNHGKTELELNMLSGLGKVSNTMDLMGTSDYLAMRREAYANDGILEYPSNAFEVNGTWNQDRYTDWQKELFGRTAYLNTVQGSLSGGNQRTGFLISGTYYGQTSVLPKDYKNDKISGLANLNHTSKDGRLELQLSTQYVSNANNLPGDASLIAKAYSLAPNAPSLYNADGSLNWENSTWSNPLARLERKYLANSSTLVSNFHWKYQPLRFLGFSANMGYTENHLKEFNSTPSTLYDPTFGIGPEFSIALHNTGKSSSWIMEPQVHFDVDMGEIRLSALAGLSFQERKSGRKALMGFGFSNNALIENLAAASDVTVRTDRSEQYRYQAVFGRVNLNHKGKYILNLTGRRDGSSRFGPEKRFANFGAIGTAWIFSEEGFVAQWVPWLSYGKLRASYGTSGSDQIGDYQYLDTYSFGSQQYQGMTALYPTRLFNPDFGWEENRKLDIALELGFFNDRLLLNGNYYRNRSSNQLVGIPLPATTGFGTLQGNLDATVENRGWELELHSINVRTKNFEWSTDFNLTLPKTRLIAFDDLEGSTYANQLVIGEPLNIAKVYGFDGVNSQTGLFEVIDHNGDGTITAIEDRQTVKSLDPEYYGGLDNHIVYKRFSLDFLFQFTKQLGYNFWSSAPIVGGGSNQPIPVLDRWRGVGDSAKFQKFSSGGDPEATQAFRNFTRSEAVIGDASFIRLQNVSISYRFAEGTPKGIGCELFLRGQNLWTITDYFGPDPETRNRQTLPTLRFLSLGTRLTF
ncbi:SusC/RagA family TonB-linked outer membrane protein [Flagellimonas olearia]|uniref:SusC/RagA family TonB-linked outer membrane protein n=1 Tax=Flagellimonas olearia TaxID=552546 RepID=A0A6I1DXT0_9FLAO|nr:SusC/RagA family TonB-linked outer membrane protein [Allomuricauda olearia]KAB7530303.1 SusC/RagA family TonB-linked outer membrane protein [Allomuricauda olearia]